MGRLLTVGHGTLDRDGRRRREKGSDADGWWRDEAFRAYAAHTRTPDFLAALAGLLHYDVAVEA